MRKAIKNIVGLQLQTLRTGQDLSQADLAAACQRLGWTITRDIVARIETGVRCVADFELMLLAECLRVDVPELLPPSHDWSRLRAAFMTRRGGEFGTSE